MRLKLDWRFAYNAQQPWGLSVIAVYQGLTLLGLLGQFAGVMFPLLDIIHSCFKSSWCGPRSLQHWWPIRSSPSGCPLYSYELWVTLETFISSLFPVRKHWKIICNVKLQR